MIGATELRDVLYILNHPHVRVPNTPLCFTDTSINSFLLKHNTYVNSINQHDPRHKNKCNIWHLRLGHPSYDKLIEINKTFPFAKIMQFYMPYDVCFYAKQK